VSLMGQWQDECAKHAPHLNVVRFHPSSNCRPTKQQIMNADIVISSATFLWSNYLPSLDRILFHRVVMDESHLLFNRACSADPYKASMIRGSNRYVTFALARRSRHPF